MGMSPAYWFTKRDWFAFSGMKKAGVGRGSSHCAAWQGCPLLRWPAYIHPRIYFELKDPCLETCKMRRIPNNCNSIPAAARSPCRLRGWIRFS